MEITLEQYQKTAKYLPSNVKISNLQLINAILYVAENGVKGFTKRVWALAYSEFKKVEQNGVLERIFEGLQAEGKSQTKVLIDSKSSSRSIHHKNSFTAPAALNFSLSGGVIHRKASNYSILFLISRRMSF